MLDSWFGDEDAQLVAPQLRDEDAWLTAQVGKPLLHLRGISSADWCHQPSITYCASSGGSGVCGLHLLDSSCVITHLSSTQQTAVLILSMCLCVVALVLPAGAPETAKPQCHA